jgi:sialate O-acetylesterase
MVQISPKSLISFLAAIALFALSGRADVSLPLLFKEHLVLQREAPVRIWGTAAAAESVVVELAGVKAETKAAVDGRWSVELPALPAGGPHRLVVKGHNQITCEDVLIGEVWVASGQSNMEWLLAKTDNAEAEIAAPSNPRVRIFKVQRAQSGKPRTDVEGQWRLASPANRANFTAVGYYFAKYLSEELDVPVGIIDSSWGGTSAAAWTPMRDLRDNPVLAGYLARFVQNSSDFLRLQPLYEQKLALWEKESGANPTAEHATPRPTQPLGPGHPNTPAGLFNGMIAPLTPLRVRGVVWYQGEADAARAFTYRTLFPALITAWRREWNSAAMPFLYVQLASYKARRDAPGESEWAELREAQTVALRLPQTGMALALDVGDANNIHPRNKREVGRRLAMQALAKVYARDLEASGPVYAAHEIIGPDLRVRFDHAAGGLKVQGGGRIEGFAVAGEDRKFVWADARIEGDSVILHAAEVSHPVAVRYAWADNPAATLINASGLPAAPFRTDRWPGVTDDKEP